MSTRPDRREDRDKDGWTTNMQYLAYFCRQLKELQTTEVLAGLLCCLLYKIWPWRLWRHRKDIDGRRNNDCRWAASFANVLRWSRSIYCQPLIYMPPIEVPVDLYCAALRRRNSVQRCVTQFMLKTCHYEKTRLNCCRIMNGQLRTCSSLLAVFNTQNQMLLTGSTAELYINPMLSCIGDIDVMVCSNNVLVIPAGHPPHIKLSVHYPRVVIVYEIISSYQPGYVYLRESYLLMRKECGCCVECYKRRTRGDTTRYLPNPDKQAIVNNFQEVLPSISRQIIDDPYVANICGGANIFLSAQTKGPALHVDTKVHANDGCVAPLLLQVDSVQVDSVSCMKCPVWPLQAGDWPTRSRNYGVPDQITINQIVDNGCHVVAVVHPRCRQDEWMNKHQWRLSFSQAEVTLLNSWTPVQQIIYHMLRFVLKREVLVKTNNSDPDLPNLSNYHIKTLMLWECEQQPQSWWSAESSLIKLCSSLLHKLSDCVEHKHCQHYFISNCNLLDHIQYASPTICDDLRYLAEISVLCNWFVDNYISKCRPHAVLSLLDDNNSPHKLHVEQIMNLMNFTAAYMTAAEETCLSSFMYETWVLLLSSIFSQFSITQNIGLKNLDPRLHDYFVAVRSLQVAYAISIGSLTKDILDELWILFYPSNVASDDVANSRRESGEYLSIAKAIRLATLSIVRSSALEMLHNEMSKAYLHHSFVCGRELCVAHVLLAALYYKSGHNQTAIDHCEQVLQKEVRQQCVPGFISAKHLPHIDECLDAVFGLHVLYQHIRQHALNSEQKLQPRGCHQAQALGQESRSSSSQAAAEPFAVCRIHLLARYLYSKSSTAVTTQLSNKVECYHKHLSQTKQPFLSDVLLFKFMEYNSSQEDETQNDAYTASRYKDTAQFVNTLVLVALENLVRVRQDVVREMHSKQFAIVNEFEALYAYKRGLFEECIRICRRDIGMLSADNAGLQIYMASSPEMLSLLDGELVSVLGIIRVLRPASIVPMNILDLLAVSDCLGIHVLTLLLYLIVQCQKRLLSDSIHNTMNLIIRVHDKVYLADDTYFFDRLILRLIYRSLRLFMETRFDLHSR